MLGAALCKKFKIFEEKGAQGESVGIVIWVAIGGRGTLSGAILGALGVNLIYNYLTSNAPELWPLLQGSLFIIVVLLFPKGFSGLLDVNPLKNFNRNPKIN